MWAARPMLSAMDRRPSIGKRAIAALKEVLAQKRAEHRAGWAGDRVVTRKAFSYRYEVKVGADVYNVASAAEALRIAQLYANTGSEVFVRDRAQRRGYL